MLVGVIAVLMVSAMFWRHCTGPDGRMSASPERTQGDASISVAIEMSPLTYNLSADTASGFDYDVLVAIGRIHDLDFEFYPVVHVEKALEGLETGLYDLVVASVPATRELKSVYRLTEPVRVERQVLVQRRDTADSNAVVREHRQLLRDTVWIVEASPYRSRLENLASELGDTIFIMSDPDYSAEHLAILTALGEIPRAVVGEAVARKVAADYPDLDVQTPVSFNQFQTWIVAPGHEALGDSLDSWLRQFKSTKQFERLAETYLSE